MQTQTLYSQQYYLQKPTKTFKKTQAKCRCCGQDKMEDLTIHHVVPRLIGQAFETTEEFLKCPTVVLCRDCHDEYECIADEAKIFYANILKVDLNCPKKIKIEPDSSENSKIRKLKTSANRLLFNGDQISTLEADEMRDLILSHLGQPFYTTADLRRLGKMEVKKGKTINIDNPEYKNLGVEILKVFDKENVKRWWIDHWHKFEAKKMTELKKNETPVIKIAVAA